MQRTLMLMAGLLVSVAAQAYQVTGPVLEVTDKKIVVQKDNEKWELACDANTKAPAAVKAGDKVTVEYTMTASKITVK